VQQSKRMPESPAVEKILKAALTVFAEEGFAGARVDEIARRAGVNKAMLYYHVGDKAVLYEEVLVRNFDRLLEAVAEAAAADFSPADRLRRVIHTVTELVDKMPEHPRIILREVAAAGASLPPAALSRMGQAAAVVRSIILDGIEDGSMRTVDPLLTHVAMIGAIVFGHAVRPIGELMQQLGLDLELVSPTATADHLAELLLHGLLNTGDVS
jgi:AcrR family transcriptional regulator